MEENKSRKKPFEGSSNSPKEKKPKENCPFGENCYRQKPEHFHQYGHPHLEKLLQEFGSDEIKLRERYNGKISTKTLLEQLKILQKISIPTKIVEKTTQNDFTGNTSSTKTGESSRLMKRPSRYQENEDIEKLTKVCKSEEKGVEKSKVMKNSSEQHLQNMKEANNYSLIILDKTKIKVSDKLKAAEPYNIFLSAISDSPPTHDELLSIQFPELLAPTLGDLVSSLQINFMVEFGWLLAQYHIMGHNRKPLTLLYGLIDEDLENFKHFVTYANVKPPSPFGSHHTKMMMFAYKDGSIRIVVSTANLVESDWDNRTQGLWVSPSCPSLPVSSDTAAGESPTFFKRDLIRYMSSYQLPQLQPWIGKVKRADLSSVNVFFISSVPGNHTTHKNNWGQLALQTALSQNVTVPDKNSYEVVVQCSSIGSLGPQPESWLLGEMLTTFCSGKKEGPVSRAPLKFMYPSFDNIVNSHDGLLGGGCLPYSQKTHMKQEWLTSFMCQWKSDTRYRSKASPHIKTYCRVSPDHSKMSYFLLTSANMSKAAWGTRSKSGSLNILSYEAGVLLLPQFIIGKDYFPLKKCEEIGETPLFSLPYDLPVTPFKIDDIPWFIDNIS